MCSLNAIHELTHPSASCLFHNFLLSYLIIGQLEYLDSRRQDEENYRLKRFIFGGCWLWTRPNNQIVLWHCLYWTASKSVALITIDLTTCWRIIRLTFNSRLISFKYLLLSHVLEVHLILDPWNENTNTITLYNASTCVILNYFNISSIIYSKSRR